MTFEEEPEVYFRKSTCVNLEDYCPFTEEGDFLELTEWVNGEGFSLNLSGKLGTRTLEMTCGEFQALKEAYEKLNKN